MNVVGIICEYNPFHSGHRHQFELIKEKFQDAVILCLMSGCFTQRGEPALFSPHDRAQAALNAGADIILQLPCSCAVRDAENFSLGGIRILNRLGFISHLCFGCEDDPEILEKAARLLEHPSDEYRRRRQELLDQGISYAAAQGNALEEQLGISGILSRPNNILAVSYYRALSHTKSKILPLPVHRDSNYHEEVLKQSMYPSAEAIRKSFLSGKIADAESACGCSFDHLRYCKPEALDQLLLYMLRTKCPEELKQLPDCSEGLENRLKNAATHCTSRRELLTEVKTKRYTYSRLSRICAHLLLGITQEQLNRNSEPEAIHLLGINPNRNEATALLKKSMIPVLSRGRDGVSCAPGLQRDLLAWDLWALGAGIPAEFMLRTPVAIPSKRKENE